ncbi:MAG: hypothetical protein JWM25_1232 [Thermoleophilia bacterium]|nr:hypothetical protein [Thermoleophilia bacterium]MCZ4496649.1 hypothetical protein [Thermoleophilia bacterium]
MVFHLRPFRAFALLLLAVLLAGCGGPDRAEYQADLVRAGDVITTALDEMPQTDRATLGPDDVDSIADDVREAADEIADLDPPDDAAKPQRRLVRGLRGVAAAFEDLATDLRKVQTDEQKAELFVKFATDPDVTTAFEDVSASQAAYVEAGYRVFGKAAPRPAK